MFNEIINEISKDIQKHEQRSRLRTTEEQPDNLSVEDIIKGDVEYSQWQDRDRMWWDRKR